ncbi:uncharacterized protein LOC143291932 [Babylonia areolata]|uniref:uncharacterized protein LOC143291932 n=1 Tax=Babylonia areolata TaxID=304850 RepID=UPI003FD459DB
MKSDRISMNPLLPRQQLLSSVVVLLLALSAFIKQGLAVKCYMCNSAPTRNNHNCAQMTKEDQKMFEQDCDYLPEVRANLTRYTVCRKMHQTIFDPDGNAEERIIRQCGTATPVGCSWQSRPNTLHVETCHCTTDLCNPATRSVYSRPLIGGLVFVTYLLTWLSGLSSIFSAAQSASFVI